MNQSKMKKTQILSLFLLIIPILSTSFIQIAGSIRYTQTDITRNITDNYIEDFTSTTYMNPTSDVFGWGMGTVTNDRNFSWALLDSYFTSTEVRDLVVQGRKAYVVQYVDVGAIDTLTCYDINDPTDIEFLSKRDTLGDGLSIAIDGDTVFMGRYASSQTFNAYNVSDASDLGGAGNYQDYVSLVGRVTDIDPQGHLVYYTVYDDSTDRSLRIVDASNPDVFVEYTPNWVSNKSLGLAVNGHLAYLASSTEGLHVLNVSDKTTPIELGHVGLPGNATDVLLDGKFAYVTLGDAGFAVVDVFDPTNPVAIAIVDVGGTTNHMALQGNTLFVTAGDSGIQIFDVANPFRPILVTNLVLPYTYDVELFGGILVAGTIDGIHTFQISATGGGITDLTNYVYENIYSDYQVWDVKVIGNIAYIAGGSDGFYTLDVRDPNNPILLDRWNLTGIVFKKLDVEGQFAHCVDSANQHIFDISDPSDIKFIRNYFGANLFDVDNRGGLSYIAVGTDVGVGDSTLPWNIVVIDILSAVGVN
ncbi:MAG: hypothetical protein FK732_07360, partial [Asgard group archaeon]|nr:hypothetical protein [Asgard group archaeon]